MCGDRAGGGVQAPSSTLCLDCHDHDLERLEDFKIVYPRLNNSLKM